MTTIKDIAEYAGVSATTVSNVIHGKSNRVSKETVERIQKAIRELNYVPNMFARSLVSNSSRVVALINHVPTRSDATFSDATFQMVFLSTIESILRENGYYLMFRRVETEDELDMFLHNWNVDGMFVAGIVDKPFYDAVASLTIPKVMVDSYVCPADTCNVGLDDEGGEYMATKHLIEKGHRRIAFTTPAMHEGYVMKARFEGYKRALSEYGIPYDSRLVYESDVDLQSCRNLADELAKINNLTAVVSSTDIMAAGILTRLHEIGVRVPEDISIIGFDDAAIAQITIPTLTTIRQDMVLKAATAAENMVMMLKGEQAANRRIELPAELITRNSVADIN